MRISHGSALWQYMSEKQQALAEDGAFLWEDSFRHENSEPTDYSYLVFPFAKLFEGFLKQLFLDLSYISANEYYSDKYRIGKAISPNLVDKLGPRSAYGRLRDAYGKDLATRVFHAWKEGRNLVFHYFPHNYRALTRQQAGSLISNLIETMEALVQRTHVHKIFHSEPPYISVAKAQSVE